MSTANRSSWLHRWTWCLGIGACACKKSNRPKSSRHWQLAWILSWRFRLLQVWHCLTVVTSMILAHRASVYVVTSHCWSIYTSEPDVVIVSVQLHGYRARSPTTRGVNVTPLRKWPSQRYQDSGPLTSMFLSRVWGWGKAALEAGGITTRELTPRCWALVLSGSFCCRLHSTQQLCLEYNYPSVTCVSRIPTLNPRLFWFPSQRITLSWSWCIPVISAIGGWSKRIQELIARLC